MKKHFTPHEKAKVALEAIRGIKSMNELSSAFGAHPIQIGLWRKNVLDRLHTLFSDAQTKKRTEEQRRLIEDLYKIIGQRDAELEWAKKNLQRLDSS